MLSSPIDGIDVRTYIDTLCLYLLFTENKLYFVSRIRNFHYLRYNDIFCFQNF